MEMDEKSGFSTKPLVGARAKVAPPTQGLVAPCDDFEFEELSTQEVEAARVNAKEEKSSGSNLDIKESFQGVNKNLVEGDKESQFKYVALGECYWMSGGLVSKGHWTFPITTIHANNPGKRIEV
mmetsp:Transcript_8532/g.13163  ORF Transcript_8532/g.13163 Transcript_8532/m.13163 type:complete len:124 (+) Transcript_8532:2490-2861(+)